MHESICKYLCLLTMPVFLPSLAGRGTISSFTHQNMIMKHTILKDMLLCVAPPLWGGPLLSLLHISNMNEKTKNEQKHVFRPPGILPSGGVASSG